MYLLDILWWTTLLVLTGYHILIFRMPTSPPVEKELLLPGVSVVIAVRDDSDKLMFNLETILAQEYDTYEVIIVDDYSLPEEKVKLEQYADRSPQIRFFSSQRPQGKKHALSEAIQHARYDTILCTDADCRPAGKKWIHLMVCQSDGGNMVLGYSPYESQKGILNWVQRFETVMTGMQYLAWAEQGKAYMGVGRNIMYPRSLFMERNPFAQHSLPYGDDDLWVQEAAAFVPVRTCVHQDAFVYSRPSTTWKQWIKQKHRHLSAAHQYKKGTWWQPGLYGISLLGHWVLMVLLALISPEMGFYSFFAFGMAVRWLSYARWARLLGDRDTVIGYPVLEVFYAVYLAVMGIFTFWTKKKTWN